MGAVYDCTQPSRRPADDRGLPCPRSTLAASGGLDTREALALADDAVAYREQLGSAHTVIKMATEEVLECALALGDRAKAEAVLVVLDALRPGELTPLYRAMRARFRGRLVDDVSAEVYFREAEQVYESLGMPFHLAVTRLEHAEALASQAQSTEADTLRATASAVFDRLDARPWRERAGDIPAGEPIPA